MQTASQIPSMPPYVNQNSQKKSNGLLIVSLIIGISLLVLGLVYNTFNPYLMNSYLDRGIGYSSITIINITVGLAFGFFGVIGLVLGIIGFRQLLREQPPLNYFMAVAAIALCLHAALGLISILFSIIASFLINIF